MPILSKVVVPSGKNNLVSKITKSLVFFGGIAVAFIAFKKIREYFSEDCCERGEELEDTCCCCCGNDDDDSVDEADGKELMETIKELKLTLVEYQLKLVEHEEELERIRLENDVLLKKAMKKADEIQGLKSDEKHEECVSFAEAEETETKNSVDSM